MTKREHSEYEKIRGCQICIPSSKVNNSLSRENPYALYSKGLPHNSIGFVDSGAYCKYAIALKNQKVDELNSVPKGGILKQLDPSAAFNDDVLDIVRHIDLGSVPRIDSDKYAANLIELYNMAVCRDIIFSEYPISPEILSGINSLSQLTEYNGPSLTNTTIFRGLSQGDVIGPYVSQFLYLDYQESGTSVINQKKTLYGPQNFMITMANAISCLNGTPLETFGAATLPRYIITGRDLALAVRSAEPYKLFYNAVQILYTLGTPMNLDLPVNSNIDPYINFGQVDVFCALAQVTRLTGLAAFCFKNKALFLRPEEGGIIVERNRLGTADNPDINDEILDNPVLNTVLTNNGNYLLAQAYPEGSELSPSWPCDRSAMAAAQSIIVKFFFKTNGSMNLLTPDITGANLIPSGFVSTIRNELDKLVSNCGYGRCWAGTNYRLDVQSGIKLGEKVAIAFLRKYVANYPQKVKVSIKRYNGKTVVIEN